MSPHLRIAICGAGIGGLTTAIALSHFSPQERELDVVIYESARSLGEIGAGIGVWPRHWKILEELGIAKQMTPLSVARNFVQRKSDQKEGVTFVEFPSQANARAFHRATFQQALLHSLPETIKVHCLSRLVSYVQKPSSSIELTFEDGRQETCDVLIGADGIHSAVRKVLLAEKVVRDPGNAETYKKCLEASWSGMVVYRGLLDRHALEGLCPNHRALEGPTQYLGDKLIINLVPLSCGKLFTCGVSVCQNDLEGTTFEGKWVQDSCPPGLLEKAVEEWEYEARAIVQCFENRSGWAVHTLHTLPTFVSGNVAILGDAAHAMNPHQGAGACQAIEDAYILSKLLTHPNTTLTNIPAILQIYDEIRRPFAQHIQAGSRMMARYLSFTAPGLESATFSSNCEDGEELSQVKEKILQTWEWAWTTTIDDAAAQGMEKVATL